MKSKQEFPFINVEEARVEKRLELIEKSFRFELKNIIHTENLDAKK